ncbi:MAG: hypothetical protein ABUS79_06495 [Pseudomonadota bacterium]
MNHSDESEHEDPPRSTKLDKRTVVMVVGFMAALAALIAANMK